MTDQPQQPQPQARQLHNAIPILDRAGLYDAADYLRALVERERQEDEEDAAAAREALADSTPPIPWEQVKEQMKAQSTPDLEPVRRLIRAAELMHEKQTYDEAVLWDRELAKYAEEALPALRSLLAESDCTECARG